MCLIQDDRQVPMQIIARMTPSDNRCVAPRHHPPTGASHRSYVVGQVSIPAETRQRRQPCDAPPYHPPTGAPHRRGARHRHAEPTASSAPGELAHVLQKVARKNDGETRRLAHVGTFNKMSSIQTDQIVYLSSLGRSHHRSVLISYIPHRLLYLLPARLHHLKHCRLAEHLETGNRFRSLDLQISPRLLKDELADHTSNLAPNTQADDLSGSSCG